MNYTKNYSLVCPRVKNNVNMAVRSVSQQDTGWRIKKEDGPSPASYDYMKSFDSTQKARITGHNERKSKRLDYVDEYAKHFKSNPPPGKYSDMDKGRALQSRPREL